MLIAIAASMTGQAFAIANYVYHERTGNDPRADAAFHNCPVDQKYVDVLSPMAGQAVTIRWKVEFQFDTDRVRLYYTTDGSNPSGAFGVGSGTTQVIVGTYDCTFRFSMNGSIWDVAQAVIPAQPPGTTVKYIVSAWKDLAGDEIFANSGTCEGCGNFNNSSLATVFSYTVPDPAERYWDANGAVAGAGGASPAGIWGTDAFWSPVADGTAATGAWVSGKNAVFAAGSDATGAYIVTLNGAQTAGALSVEEGNVTVSGTDELTLGGNVTVASGATATLGGPVAGSGGIVKSGAGTLTLAGTNTYTGNTVVNAGVLELTQAGGDANLSLGAVPGAFTANSLQVNDATLRLAGGIRTFHVNRGITLGGAGATIDMPVSGGIWFIPTAVEGAGTTVTKTGQGELGFYGAANKFAKLVIDQGQLRIGQSTFPGLDESYGAVPASVLADAVTIRNGATNHTAGSTAITTHANRGFTMGPGGGVIRNNTQPLTINGPVTGLGGMRKEGNRNLTLNGTIDYAGDTVMNGVQSGSQTRAITTINGYNNTPGNLIVTDGRLVINNGSSYASVLLAGGRIDANTNNALGAGTLTIAPAGGQTNPVLLAQSTTLGTGPLTNATLPNDIVLTAGPVAIDISANAGRELILTGKVSGNSDWIKNNSGSSGAVVLSNPANDFTGVVRIFSGTVVAEANNALGSTSGMTIISNNVSLVLRGGVNYTAPEPVRISGGGRNGAGSVNSTTGNNAFNGPIEMFVSGSVGASAGSSLTLNGVISEFSGTPTLTNVGAGLVTLTAANTYSGGTVIRGNVRIANGAGSALGSGPVTIDLGGSLSGPGSVSGAVTVVGTLSPGASPGVISTGSETWAPGGNYVWEINDVDAGAGSGWDVANITGTLTIPAEPWPAPFRVKVTSLLLDNTAGNVHDFDPNQEYTWTIATTTGGITGFAGNFFQVDASAFSNPETGRFFVEQSGNDVVLRYIPAPVITADPVSAAKCEGTPHTFSGSATGVGTITYQWYFNNGAIGGATAATYDIATVTPAHGGPYYVVASNAGGSATSAVAVLTVNLTTATTDPADQTVCPGANVTFTTVASGTGPFSYAWFKGATPLGITTDTLTLNNVSASDEATYCVEVTGLCNMDSECAVLTLNQATTAAGPTDQTGCPGGEATFTTLASGTGPFSYVWRKDGALIGDATSSSLTVSNIAEAQEGMYCVEVSGLCNSVTNCATLTMLTNTAAVGPVDTEACSGGNVTLTTTASGTGPHSYVWRKDGTVLMGETSATLSISNADGEDEGTYCVEVTGFCNSVTNCAVVTINDLIVAVGPTNTQGCVGGSVTLSVAATGAGPITYVWRKDGGVVPGANSSSLVISPAALGDSGNYCVEVTGLCDSVTNCAAVTVNANPTVSVNSEAICMGGSATLTATHNAASPTFSWSPGGATTASILVSPSSTTVYTVTVTDAATGCSSSANGTVTVNPLPTVSVNSETICAGGSATLTATTDASSPSYLWSPGGQITASITVSPASTTTYTVTVTDGATTCQNSGSGTVQVGGVDSFANAGSISINDLSTATPYPSVINVSGLTATVCRVTVTLNNLGHAFPDDVDMLLVGPNGVGTLLMSDNGGGNPISGVTLTFDDTAAAALPDSGPIVSGTYKPSNVGSKADGTVFNDVFAAPAPAPAGTFVTNLAVFNGINPNGAWSLYIVDDEFYDVGVVAGGWSLSISTQFPIADVGVAQADVPDPVGVGSNLTYTVTVSNNGPATALGVSLSDTLPAGVTFVSVGTTLGSCNHSAGVVTCNIGSIDAGGSAVVTIVVTPNGAGTLSNVATISSTSVDFVAANNTSTANTTVENPPVITVPPANLTVCAGQTASFSVTATGDAPLSYQWSFDGTPILGATSPTLNIPNAQAGNAGTYSVLVQNNVGGDEASATLTVTALPVVTVNSETICFGQSTTLTATHNAASPTYLWSPGGATTQSILVSPGTTTLYTVTVTDGATTCSGNGSGTVTVNQLTTATALTSLTNVCLGTAIGFSTTAGGTGPHTYRWTKNGAEIAGETSSSLSIASVAPGDAGTYCVEVTGICNSVTNCATLTVVPPPTITAQPANQSTPMGNFATFSVGSTSVVASSIQWQFNDVDIPGANSPSLTVGPATFADAGGYRAIVSNCGGTATSATAFLTVTPISGVSFDFNTPGQFTNAPYAAQSGNDWVQTQNGGGTLPWVVNEQSTGGVGGSGAIDPFAVDLTMMEVSHRYDFSLPGKTLYASTMVRLVAPTANGRASQIGFVALTNAQSGTAPGFVPRGINTETASQLFMTVILQSIGQPAMNYELRLQYKTNGVTTAVEQTALAAATLTAGNWYRLVAKFENTHGVTPNTMAITGSLLDMGADGLTPLGPVMSFGPITVPDVHLIAHRALSPAIRTASAANGADLWDDFSAYTSPDPVTFVQEPTAQTVNHGHPAEFRVLVDGEGPYSYQWLTNGVPVPGATGWKYITPPATTADNGTLYSVRVNNSFGGEISSAGVPLNVTPLALTVTSVGSVDGCTVGVSFNQAVDAATAGNAANYLINGVPAAAATVFISSADLLPHRVLLTPASILSGSFTVEVSNVKDLSNNTIGANSTGGTVAGLIGVDINSPVIAPVGQQYSFAPGQFEVTAGGSDIFTAPDSFRYVYTQKTGDFDVKARIPYLDIIRQPTKAGFSVRASLDPASPQVLAAVNPKWPGRALYEGTQRPTYAGAASSWGNSATPARYPDVWVRFRRAGNTFLRYASQDGVTWTLEGQTTPVPPLPPTVYLGLSVCSVLQGTLVRAQYEQYGDFGGYAGATGINITAQTASSITVAAGSSSNLSVTATVTGATVPAGELAYTWQRNGVAVGGGSNNVFNTGALFASDNGAVYQAIVSSAGLSVTSAPITVTVTDSAAPTLTAAGIPANSAAQVSITFSEPVSTATAQNAANYVITNQAGVNIGVASAVQMINDPRIVVLTTFGPLVAGNYGVRVSNVQDLQGNAIAANSLRTFSQVALPPPVQANTVVTEIYYGIGGADLAALGNFTNTSRFINRQADSIVYGTTFGFNGGQTTFPDQVNNYGARIQSLFVPTNTGLYRFYIRSDDASILYMNTNAANSTDPAGKVVLISRNGANANYGTAADQLLQNVPLTANQRYYIEALFKEGTGGDGFALAVQPQATTGTPGAATIIGGNQLAFPTNTALPTPVLVDYFGFTAWTNRGAFGEPIPSATPNLTAFAQLTNDVRFINDTPDNVLWAQYNNTFGYDMVLADSGRNRYGGRLRAYFVAPSSGLYRFWIKVDDTAQLFMNTNAVNSMSPAGAVLLVSQNAFVSTNYTTSAQNVPLVGGQRYYLEARFLEGGGGDGFGLAVRAQSDPATPPSLEYVPASMLQYPASLDRRYGNIRLAGITPANPTAVEGQTVTFTASGVFGAGTAAYTWFKNGVLISGNSATYTTQPLTMSDSGATVSVLVSNAFSTATASTTITVTQDATAPTLLSATGSQFDSVTLLFSEAIEPTTAMCLVNYQINNGLKVLGAALDPSRTKVTLLTTPQTAGTVYTVTVSELRDFGGDNLIAPNPSTASFGGWDAGGCGVFVEVFTGFGGTAVQNLLDHPKFQGNFPDLSGYVPNFSFGTAPQLGNLPIGAASFMHGPALDNYGARLTALFMAPSNGLYRFYVRGDDGTMLFMNTNGPSAGGKVRIARNDGANSATYESGTGGSVSPVISLTAGSLYYMEGLMKEGTGGDYITVAFRPIDQATLQPIGGPPQTNEIASGEFFKPYGDPTQSSIVVQQAPPADLTVFENDYVTLSVRAEVLPRRIVNAACFKWEKLDLLSLNFATVATGSNYNFYASLADDGLPVRLTIEVPGTNIVYETTLHVNPDTQPPVMVSARSLDGLTIDVCFSEQVDPLTAFGPDSRFNYIVNNQGPGEGIITVSNRHDPRFASLILSTPVSGEFTLGALFIGDLAGQSGFSEITGRAQDFLARDIGVPLAPGYSFSCGPDAIDVLAGGADIWANSDTGHMTLSLRLGDFDIWTRVHSLSRSPVDTDTISKAGLMVRENTNSGSRVLHFLVNPPFGTPPVGGRDLGELGQRPAPNQNTAIWPGTAAYSPVGIPNAWIRLKRVGDIITGFRSFDGANWNNFGSITVGYGDRMWIGLATTAHVPNPSGAGTVLAQYRDIHIPDTPIFLTQPSPETQTVAAGTAVTYSVVVSNPPNAGPLVYQWWKNDVRIPGQTNASLSLASVSAGDAGTYYVWAGNDGGNSVSASVTLLVNNGAPVAGTDNVTTDQNTIANFNASTLLANDSHPLGLGLSLVGVSGIAPASFVSDFNSGLPTGAQIFGNATVETAGGANNSGHIRLNPGVGNQAGSIVLPDLTPGRRVTSFSANFKLKIFDGSNQAADGFSFNFAPDIQLTANTGLGENGVGTGISFCVDNFQFAPYPVGGTGFTSGMKIRYRGIDLAGIQTPTWMENRFVPVAITVSDKGILNVYLDGTNAFSVALPGYTFSAPGARFAMYGRTGGEFQSHAIDDLNINLVTTLETARTANYGGTLYGNATVGGGVLHLTDNLNGQQGAFISDVLGTGTFTSMQADFLVRMGGGTARPADGFSFSLASDLPAGSFSEEGAGTYLTVSLDSWDNAGTDTAPSIEVKYGGVADANIVATQSLDGQREGGRAPHTSLFLSNGVAVALAAPDFVPMSIHLDGDGTIDVSYKGNVIFNNLAIPGFVAGSNLRFGLGARTGGANDNHWIDNLGVTINTTGLSGTFTNEFTLPPIGTVTHTNGIITYTPPGNACGSDSFYYIVSDGTATSIGQVNVSIAETNPTPPTIVLCVPNQVLGVDGTCQAVLPDLTTQIRASDSCCCLTITQSPLAGTPVTFGDTTVTFTVTDTGGLTATCQAVITVADTNGPVILCPPNLVAECTNAAGTVVTFATPTATDNCGPASPVVSCVPPSGTAFLPGTNVVTCSAQDTAGNTGSCTFNVIVVDTTPPSIVCPPAVIALVNDTQCTATNVPLGAPSGSDNCGGVVFANNAPSVYPVGTTTVTWVATDGAGNTAICMQSVTIRDARAPVIVCPTNITVECGSSLNPTNTGSATATDECDTSPTITTQDRAVFVTTTNAPGSLHGWEFSTTASGGPENTAIAELVNGPGTPPLGTGSVRLAVGANGAGAAQIRNTNFATRLLTHLTALQYSTYRTQNGTGDQLPYMTLNVDHDGNGTTDDVLFFEPFYQRPIYNPNLPDQGPTQTGIWQTWNAFGGGWYSLNGLAGLTPGTGVKPLSTYIAAFPNAQLAGVATAPLRIVAGFGAGAWDNFDGNVDAVVLMTIAHGGQTWDLERDLPGACAPVQTSRLWIATDDSGNANSCAQFIKEVDTTAPALACPGNLVVGTDPGVCSAAVSFSVTVTNACDAGVVPVCVPASGTTFALGTTPVTCTATDVCGNTTNCTFNVTVNDTTAPQITCPANITLPCTSTNGAVATFSATATDNCTASPVIVCTPASGSTFPLGTTTVTCAASDAANNTNTCTFTVTVTGDGSTPMLTITKSGANVNICWPQTCASFVLEESANLTTWTGSTATPVLSSGTYCVTLPASTPYQFFRLRQN